MTFTKWEIQKFKMKYHKLNTTMNQIFHTKSQKQKTTEIISSSKKTLKKHQPSFLVPNCCKVNICGKIKDKDKLLDNDLKIQQITNNMYKGL